MKKRTRRLIETLEATVATLLAKLANASKVNPLSAVGKLTADRDAAQKSLDRVKHGIEELAMCLRAGGILSFHTNGQWVLHGSEGHAKAKGELLEELIYRLGGAQ